VSNGPEPVLGRPDGRKTGTSLRDLGLGRNGPAGPLLVSLLATIVATALSYALPDSQAATGVGLVFLVFTYLLVLRDADAATVKESGLSLGGLFEPEPLSPAQLARSALTALGWAFAFALVLFPPFWLGFVAWHAPAAHFAPASLLALGRDVLGQVFGVAFPEEVFFRGYLQSALNRAWPPRFKVFGAPLGPSLLVASAIFALGHLSTDPHPARLAVFFPSLVFGVVRARTGGVGASIAFHALCNLFASFLGRSYGLY
jgi:membrane protease YdiL (CAAX protease family)